MKNKNDIHLSNLAEIRSIMERTTSFISLSGLSGIFAGLFAILGALTAWWFFDFNISTFDMKYYFFNIDGSYNFSTLFFIFFDAFLVLILALSSGIFFSLKKAKKKSAKLWDKTAKRVLVNLIIPLFTGGLFILVLFYHKEIYLIASVTLIFYGLALINASKYTLNDIRYLGICETLLGLISAIFYGYGLIFWTVGFGLLHIFYGIIMYYKYEK